MLKPFKNILLIGGTDSSGGAGLTRDVAVATELGLGTKPVVTAVTAQHDHAVTQLETMSPTLVVAQISAAFEDQSPNAVKIGMLGNAALVDAVAGALAGRNVPILLDPVIASSSGARLLSDEGVDLLKETLLPQVDLVTPNKPEAEILGSSELKTLCNAILFKGGHGDGDRLLDRLWHVGHEVRFEVDRQPFTPRGTGCSLGTAIACRMAHGFALEEAVGQAHLYVQDWISRQQPAP